ncbi:O-antigen ligase family protein [Leifsonia sp. L25]|uniref:O-antigen ligase family protein n=1 Tax=Actinomycetes TaxID=1760 RepID=UPI003D69D0F4
MSPLLLFGGAVAILAIVLLMIAVPPRLIRGVAVSFTVVAASFGLASFAPDSVRPPTALAAIGVLVLALVRSRADTSGGVRFWAVAAWWGFISLSVFLAGSYGTNRIVLYFGLATLAAYVASSLSRAELRMVYATIAGLTAVQVGLAFAEILVLAEPIWGYAGTIRYNPFTNDVYARAQGTFGHPIVFAVYIGIAMIVAWSNPARWSQKWRLANLTVATVGLALSGTRSAVAAVAVGLLVHIALNSSLTSWLRAALGVGAVIVVLLNIDIGIGALVDNLLDSGSWTHRLGAAESVGALLDRPPMEAWFGTGFGGEAVLYDRGLMQQTFLRAVDNMLVYALGTTGIVGLIALLALWIVAFCFADRTIKAVLAMLFAMFFSFDLFTWMNIGVITSLMIALPRADKPVTGVVPRVDSAPALGTV